MWEFLAENWDTVEGDWSIHHHRDLVADVFGEPIGVRKLRVYLEAIPAESATAKALFLRRTGLAGDEGERAWAWTNADEQRAFQSERLADIQRAVEVLAQVWGAKPFDKPAFEYPRPGRTAETEEAPTLATWRSTLLGR